MSADKLEHLVLNKLQSRLNELQETDIELELSLKEEKTKETLLLSLQQSERQLKAYDIKQSRLMDLYLDNGISRDEFDKLKEKIDAEQTVLLQENNRIQSLLNDQKKQKEALKTLKQLLGMFIKFTDLAVRKEMIQRIIDCVVISEDHIDVIYQYGTEGTHWLNVKPQPCGFLGSTKKSCICTAHQIASYRKRLSGPLLDRIDLHVFCSEIPAEKLTAFAPGEKSKDIRQRVQKAHERQQRRYKNLKITNNAELPAKDIKNFCQIGEESLKLLRQAVNTMNLSGRGYHRVLKVARTIADLAASEEIKLEQVAEALQYRQKD